MPNNKICPFCQDKNTYYKGNGKFHCKKCDRDFVVEFQKTLVTKKELDTFK